ncbi:MAG TPA: gluconate 2-dehydrogenase subunit 3 family protein [Opitutaceae bacterium]|nr:gluconate 2-dehydrogenase subunit 3 family protein [Opitutaceae bacterium]
MNLTRREAIIRLATAMGASIVGPRLLAAPLSGERPHGFSAGDLVLMNEIGETIIPATDIPGAKAVGIGEFMAMMVSECMDTAEQDAFEEGLAELAAAYRAKHKVDFAAGRPEDRTEFLNRLDRELRGSRPGEGPQYFRVLKELTLLGYFTSEVGCTQALRYEEVPGRYDGNAPYRKGERGFYNL